MLELEEVRSLESAFLPAADAVEEAAVATDAREWQPAFYQQCDIPQEDNTPQLNDHWYPCKAEALLHPLLEQTQADVAEESLPTDFHQQCQPTAKATRAVDDEYSPLGSQHDCYAAKEAMVGTTDEGYVPSTMDQHGYWAEEGYLLREFNLQGCTVEEEVPRIAFADAASAGANDGPSPMPAALGLAPSTVQEARAVLPIQRCQDEAPESCLPARAVARRAGRAALAALGTTCTFLAAVELAWRMGPEPERFA